jgi:hypothetical protein
MILERRKTADLLLDSTEPFQIILHSFEFTLLSPRIGRLGNDLVLLADLIQLHL